jgi:hypothetical protein
MLERWNKEGIAEAVENGGIHVSVERRNKHA